MNAVNSILSLNQPQFFRHNSAVAAAAAAAAACQAIAVVLKRCSFAAQPMHR